MAKWRCKKARSNFYSPITAYLLFLHAYNFGRIFTTKTCGFVQITVYCQPSSDTLYPPPPAAALQLTRQQETVSYVCRLQLFALKWNLAIMSSSIWWEILDFIHARAEQLRWKENVRQSKDIGRGPQPSTKPSRPPRRISQMFPFTGYPYVRNLQQRKIITFSSLKKYSEQ